MAVQTDLMAAVDSCLALLSDSWTVSIPFRIAPSMGDHMGVFETQDICQFLGKPSIYQKLYFDPASYPPASAGGSIDLLKKDLQSAALCTGSPLFCNGGNKGCHLFRCNASINREHTKEIQDRRSSTKSFRSTSLVNDKVKNSRGSKGRTMTRRTLTAVSDKSCPFHFNVRSDHLGYYISLYRSYANPNHKYHAKMDGNSFSIPLRLLDTDEIETLRHLAESCVGNGVGWNYIFSKTGRYLSSCRIAYISSPDIDPKDETSDYDHLLEYFNQTDEIAYTVLWDVAQQPMDNSLAMQSTTPARISTEQSSSPSLLVSETKLSPTQRCEKDHSDEENMSELITMTREVRIQQNLPHDAKLFVAIAWVVKADLRWFKMFPEVVHVDGTSHSCKGKYNLLTFSIKTSLGKQVVFLQIWLPNECLSLFQWVFQHVLCGLLPKEVFERTQLVMGDGDRQQSQGILQAIGTYMTNACLGGCGWHIVDHGFI